MFVWIAKIEARSAAFPAYPALDRYIVRREMHDPHIDILALDRKREMRGPVRVVRGNEPSVTTQSLGCRSALKEQQHALSADVERADSRSIHEHRKPEYGSIEGSRKCQVSCVKRSLQNAQDSWSRRLTQGIALR